MIFFCAIVSVDDENLRVAAHPFGIEAETFDEALGKATRVGRKIFGNKKHFVEINDSSTALISDPEKASSS